MASEVLNNYISKRYDRWLDYAKYHCSHSGLDDEAVDVLNEVLAMLLEKFNSNQSYILQLYESKKGQYTELDFYILQMIKLNITSETSPYRHKYKAIPVDDNVDFQWVDILDDTDNERDRSGDILDQMHLVREAFDSLYLSEKAKQVFLWKFFESNTFSEWEGPEEKAVLYDIYNRVLELIKSKINGESLF